MQLQGTSCSALNCSMESTKAVLSCPEDVRGMPPTAGSTRAQLPLPSLALLAFLSNGVADTSFLTDTLYCPRRNVSLIASRPSATNGSSLVKGISSLGLGCSSLFSNIPPPPPHSLTLFRDHTCIPADQVLEISAMLRPTNCAVCLISHCARGNSMSVVPAPMLPCCHCRGCLSSLLGPL